ncbi:MAG: LytR/AlgR family response regulator transcription factor [Rhodothermaceae bacterium]
MIKAIIIDDEISARDNIKTILLSCHKNVKVVGEAETVEESVKIINSEKPDLIFLDVELTDGTGFDILKKIKEKSFKIIFTTAHQNYAIDAIKFGAFDFMLKPYKTSELIDSVNKLINEHIDQYYSLKFEAMFSNINNSHPELKKIALKTAEKIHLVNIKDILHCGSENNYTHFLLNDGKKILVSKPIKKFDEMLTEHSFMRVHQSHLVNLNYIQHYDKQDGGMLVMTNNDRIPVSGQQKPYLLKYFDSL